MLPPLPPRAAYITLNNPTKRNALSLSVLRALRTQLTTHLTSRATSRLLLLPPFRPSLLSSFTSPTPPEQHQWLVSPHHYQQETGGGLPKVLVLRSEGDVFSSGHDLREVRGMSAEERRELFSTCAEVMSLIRRSPIPVVCAVQGLATAAGAQLALTADITIANASTKFQLPGMTIGLPCTSPVTAISRRVGRGLAYRMFATGEGVRADQLGGAVDVVRAEGEQEFETRVAETVNRIVTLPSQPQTLGKWMFWTQAGLGDRNAAGEGGVEDGFSEAAKWAGGAMCLHAAGEEAEEGMDAFLGKREAKWAT